ncbi:MAG: PEP-CTERM sorting domain-containing protein [Pirellulaceae bacterium]|nr:PEP-CTERM sorting domain-containing protein [Planctomycetales bacterium]
MMTSRFGWKSSLLSGLAIFAVLSVGTQAHVHAIEVLGIGTGALLGNDLTDRDGVHDENLYNPPADFGGFDATFFSSDEPGFGGGESAFNVFDDAVGGGNDKWCCGTSFPQFVGAQLERPYVLTHFTVASGNDSPQRRPTVWTLDGSNDGSLWTTIYSRDDPTPLWDADNQVIKFTSGVDYNLPIGYSFFRMNTTATGSTTGAFFQVNEIELFGIVDDNTKVGDVNNDGNVDLLDLDVIRNNFFQSVAGGRSDGDINIDGVVNFVDFRLWKDDTAGSLAATASVPEPATGLLVLGLGLLVPMIRRRIGG